MDGQNLQNENVAGPEQPKKSNGLAIAGMVLGIISIIGACCSPIVGVALAIGGLVCSIMSKKQGPSGMATAGLVCSIIGIVIAVINAVAGAVLIANMPELQNILDSVN